MIGDAEKPTPKRPTSAKMFDKKTKLASISPAYKGKGLYQDRNGRTWKSKYIADKEEIAFQVNLLKRNKKQQYVDFIIVDRGNLFELLIRAGD